MNITKTQTSRQVLAAALKTLKGSKEKLAEVKAHIKARFEEEVSDRIIHGQGRKEAEQKALENALFRCETWATGY